MSNADAAGHDPVEPGEADEAALFQGVENLQFDDAAAETAPVAGEVPAGGVAAMLATVTSERDGYLDALQRLKAEFANHRRRTAEQATQQREQAAAGIVEKLLPVLDSCDAALTHDAESPVRPIFDALNEVLTRDGLTRIGVAGETFSPDFHDAVMHEPAADGADPEAGPVIAEVLRAGYAWNGRVLRPAMVKVRG